MTMTKMIKTKLSKTDTETFKLFEIQYPGWTVVRYIDNSMEHIPPKRESLNNKDNRRILRDIGV